MGEIGLVFLRAAAASEHEWAEARIALYREDGVNIPEPVTRLHALAGKVLNRLPTLGAMFDNRDDSDQLRRAREGIASVRMSLDTLMAEIDGAPREIIEAMPSVSKSGPEDFGGEDYPSDGPQPMIKTLAEPGFATFTGKGPDVAAKGVSAPPSLDTSPSLPPVARDAGGRAADGPEPVERSCAVGWPASGLYHGLVLTDGTRKVAVFSEAAEGQFQVSTVIVAGSDTWEVCEPFSVVDKGAFAAWHLGPQIGIKPKLRRYDEPLHPQATAAKSKASTPAADRTIALPGMADVVPAPKKTIKDYSPPESQYATWANALSKAAKKTIEEGEVRSCFAQWQTAQCNEEKPNPAAAFWQHARKTLVPAT